MSLLPESTTMNDAEQSKSRGRGETRLRGHPRHDSYLLNGLSNVAGCGGKVGSIGPHQSGLMLTERPNSTLDDKEDRSARWGKQEDGVAARRAGIGGKERRRSGMQMRCLNAVPLCHAQSVAAGSRPVSYTHLTLPTKRIV